VLLPRRAPVRLTTARPQPERRAREGRRHFRMRVREWRRAEAARESRLDAWLAAEAARLSRGTSVAFAGYGDGPVTADVAVAVDRPYVLGASRATSKLATYGTTAGAMGALVDVLLGRAPAPGRLPVAVRGVERRGC
jgi:beta-N-acetylhexosaminidase